MQLNPHLVFNGQCEAAFKFYEQTLGGKIVTMLTYRDSPVADQVAPEWRQKIMHATLAVGSARLMGADAPPGQQETTAGFSVVIGIENPADAERIFHALAENGTVRMPLQQTFWTVRF